MKVRLEIELDTKANYLGQAFKLSVDEVKEIEGEMQKMFANKEMTNIEIIEEIFKRWTGNKAVYAFGLFSYALGYSKGYDEGREQVLRQVVEARKAAEGGA